MPLFPNSKGTVPIRSSGSKFLVERVRFDPPCAQHESGEPRQVALFYIGLAGHRSVRSSIVGFRISAASAIAEADVHLRLVACCFENCQYRSMSNQDVAEPGACCSPLVREPLTEDWAGDLARMFKALGDPVRLRLLSLVASHEGGEACVCDISDTFDLSQPTISHHLKVLRQAGLLDCERRGTWVYYWVIPAALQQLSAVLLVEGSTVTAADACAEVTA